MSVFSAHGRLKCFVTLTIVISLSTLFQTVLWASDKQAASANEFQRVAPTLISSCDPATPLSVDERTDLLQRLESTPTGKQVLSDFRHQYGTIENLAIQWDAVSYSQVAKPAAQQVGRSPASQSGRVERVERNGFLGPAICVHLAKKLPEVEHLADLAHELTHATRLEMKVLKGELEDVNQFVKLRLGDQGGEADAFSVECKVKKEVLGKWDNLCRPYVSSEHAESIDVALVVKDLYNGKLSASLTGEPYPVMLSRQYRALLARRKFN